eukprot:2757841-Rhodomonas_salina.2
MSSTLCSNYSGIQVGPGFPSDWKVKTDGHVMVPRAFTVNKKRYINCTVLEPADCCGDTIMLPISKLVLTQKQIEAGLSEDCIWWMLKLLKINLGNPRIL